MRARLRFAIAVSTLLGACEHGTPFHPGDYGSKGPHTPGDPTQLTFSPAQDLQPAWLPDGSGIVYTAERRDRHDHDRCLAFMPGGGGVILRYACRTNAPDDTLNVFEEAAPRGDSIAYMRLRSQIALNPVGPQGQDLVVAATQTPNTTRVLQSVPFTASWGRTYDALTHIAWVGTSRLAAVGERVTYPRPPGCPSCARDTVRTGLDVLLIDFSSTSPILTRITAADSASSVAASANGDTLYFTRDGDSRVYRHVLASGNTDTLYDWGFGIARDLSVAGGKLAAIVGGAVTYTVDSILGGSQPDHGGTLFVLVSSGSSPVQLGNASWLLRRPNLSPDGTRLVVSAWTGGPTADIWLFQVP